MKNWYLDRPIGQPCDSKTSVPYVQDFCNIKYQKCQRSQINFQVVFVIIVPVTAVNLHIRTSNNRSMFPTLATASN